MDIIFTKIKVTVWVATSNVWHVQYRARSVRVVMKVANINI